MTFKEGQETIETQTGIIVPETIKSLGSDMAIHFESDYQGTGKGFKIMVQYVLSGKDKKVHQQELHVY